MNLLRSLLLMLLICVSAVAESLPQWSDEDDARLRRGEIIAGIDILVEDKEVMAALRLSLVDEVLPTLPKEVKLVYDPHIVPEDFLKRYFALSESNLIDPQKLLSNQEYLDREGFLNYHAENSTLKVKMYLFDAEQNLPESHAIDEVCKRLYADEALTAVVFCFLGNPDRTQLAFSGRGAADIKPSKRREILESAKIKAMSKSDPVMQLESFIVQLSISLFWLETDLEKVMAGIAAEESRALAGKAWQSGEEVGSVEVIAADHRAGIEALKHQLHWIILGLLGLLCIVASCAYGFRVWRKSQRYLFPVIEMPERLGASYAAGVGAVLIFHKKLGSPSNQRNQIPDYLRRI